jgi:hypothetical protein
LQNLAKLRALPPTDRRLRQEFFDIVCEVRYQKEAGAERHPQWQDGSRNSTIMMELISWADLFKWVIVLDERLWVLESFFQQVRSASLRKKYPNTILTENGQFVVINALIYYSQTLFESMGLDYDMQLVLSGVLNVTQLVGVSSSPWTMDRFGRRALLLLGSVTMTISHFIIAILVGLYDKDWPAHRGQGWTRVAFLFFFIFFTCFVLEYHGVLCNGPYQLVRMLISNFAFSFS